MKIGLYSEVARSNIIKIQEEIKNNNINLSLKRNDNVSRKYYKIY